MEHYDHDMFFRGNHIDDDSCYSTYGYSNSSSFRPAKKGSGWKEKKRRFENYKQMKKLINNLAGEVDSNVMPEHPSILSSYSYIKGINKTSDFKKKLLQQISPYAIRFGVLRQDGKLTDDMRVIASFMNNININEIFTVDKEILKNKMSYYNIDTSGTRADLLNRLADVYKSIEEMTQNKTANRNESKSEINISKKNYRSKFQETSTNEYLDLFRNTYF